MDPVTALATDLPHTADFALPAQVAYLVVTLIATVWVARTLHRNGALFLIDAFGGRTELAAAVNDLLVVGFYLVNIGLVLNKVHGFFGVDTTVKALEAVAPRIGGQLFVLGAMHFFNLFVLFRLRRRNELHHAPPPVYPAEVLRTA